MRFLLATSQWFMDRAGIFAGIAAAIVVALGLAPDAGPSADVDEYAHAGAFLMIAFLFCATSPRHPWLGMLAAFAMGTCIELAQIFVPGRTASLADIGANVAGVIAGAALFYLFVRMRAHYKADTDVTL